MQKVADLTFEWFFVIGIEQNHGVSQWVCHRTCARIKPTVNQKELHGTSHSSIFPGIGGVDGQVLVNFRRDLNIETGLGGQCHQSVSTQKLDDLHHPGVYWLAE